MEIIVLVKAIPLVEGISLTIKGSDIAKDTLKFALNELDDYALEKALRLKEAQGGRITLLTLASDKSQKFVDQMIRECYAKGADEAIALIDSAFDNLDSYQTAKILSEVIKGVKYDLVLTGVQTVDDGAACVGIMIAELLGIPHASMVTQIEPGSAKDLKIHRELEEGVDEFIELTPPALLTIQSGTETPRYAPFAKIRLAMKKEIKILSASAVNLQPTLLESLRKTGVKNMQIPTSGKQAQIIEGNPEEKATRLAQILKDKGFGRS